MDGMECYAKHCWSFAQEMAENVNSTIDPTGNLDLSTWGQTSCCSCLGPSTCSLSVFAHLLSSLRACAWIHQSRDTCLFTVSNPKIGLLQCLVSSEAGRLRACQFTTCRLMYVNTETVHFPSRSRQRFWPQMWPISKTIPSSETPML